MPAAALLEAWSWPVLWAWVQMSSWAVYAGGAFTMEAVWRATQVHLPQSQIAVACNWMGHRYRWVASCALAGAAIGGAGVELVAQQGLGIGELCLWLGWLGLAGVLATITFVGHPALHARSSAELSAEERAASREAVGRAIRRMDVLLRADLAIVALSLVALAASTASLPRR